MISKISWNHFRHRWTPSLKIQRTHCHHQQYDPRVLRGYFGAYEDLNWSEFAHPDPAKISAQTLPLVQLLAFSDQYVRKPHVPLKLLLINRQLRVWPRRKTDGVNFYSVVLFERNYFTFYISRQRAQLALYKVNHRD
jgi:hypothetical protein